MSAASCARRRLSRAGFSWRSHLWDLAFLCCAWRRGKSGGRTRSSPHSKTPTQTYAASMTRRARSAPLADDRSAFPCIVFSKELAARSLRGGTRDQSGRTFMAWNFGDILDAISPVLPQDAPAFVHGERRITWGEATKRTNNLGRALIERGAKPGDKVAFYMRNRPEYVETLAACYKARLTHVNVNYRYKPDEVFYIFDNSDAQTVVYGSEFREVIEEIRPRLTKVETFVEVN